MFTRLPIRAKLVIAFSLFAVLPLVLAGGYGAYQGFVLLSEDLRSRLAAEATLKSESIGRLAVQARADVVFLAALPTVWALARERSRAAATRAGEALLAFARSRPAYDQLRYLDGDGGELVRVEAAPPGPVLAAVERLQRVPDDRAGQFGDHRRERRLRPEAVRQS